MRNNTLETIREFKTRNFTVRAVAVEDFDLDLSFDATGETLRELERGNLVSFGVVVTVFFNGAEIGQDSLWNCIYKTPSDFMDHRGLRAKSRADGCNYGSYFSDMVHNAINEARKQADTFRKIPLRTV